jgi:hypothetical protein
VNRQSSGEGRTRQRGQSLVEFTIILPVFMILLLMMLELGFLLTDDMTVLYASREGARTGASLAQGSATVPCATAVDPLIIAAVERTMTSPGSLLSLPKVGQIRLYKADANGNEAGPVNIWTYAAGGGPIPQGSTTHLDFKETSHGWDACSRKNGPTYDSIGVSVAYRYDFVTGLAAMISMIRGGTGTSININDRAVMALNPTNLGNP